MLFSSRVGRRSLLRARPLCCAVAGVLLACAGAPDPGLQGAVLVVLDTLRADGLSAYGNPRRASPHLDALAARGVLFERAVSHAASTLPGFVGLLSGRYPSGAVMDGALRRSLVEPLRAAGFRTVAFTEGGFVSEYFGMDRGFDSFVEQEGAVRLRVAGRAVADAAGGGIETTFAAARAWLEAHASERFFLLVHTYEVHTPYRRLDFASELPRGALPETFEIADVSHFAGTPEQLGAAELAYVRALYDGGVAEADRHVGELLDTLSDLGLAERTLVVVTSDHGEDLGDRVPLRPGTHGHGLFDELVRIPLLVYDPRLEAAGRRVRAQVRLVDVLPTILDLLGVAPDPEADGSSLAPLLRGESDASRPAYGQLVRGRTAVTESLRDERFKLIRRPFPEEPPVDLYDLVSDPRESRNLADELEDVRVRLERELDQARPDLRAEGLPVYVAGDRVSEELRERLEALGYVE